MKKLAVAFLLVVSACGRQTAVSASELGSPNAREAVNQFMATVKSQDLDAMGRIWGSKSGPSMNTQPRGEREQREVVMMRCLKHDRFAILSETPGSGGERHFNVELRYKELVAATVMVASEGPGGRWYLERVAMEGLQPFCVAL